MSIGPAESLAKQVVEAVHPDVRLEYRSDQHGDGVLRHDFWLYRPERERAALEVTAPRDEERMRTRAKLQELENSIRAEECEWTWWVHLKPDTEVSRVEQRIDGYLSLLETEGAERFHRSPLSRSDKARSGLSEELNVRSASAIPEMQPPRIFLHTGEGPGMNHAQVVYDMVHDAVAENQEKLGETDSEERHLFVVVDPLEGAGACIEMADVEPVVPDLPPEVTHVWAAGRSLTDAGRCDVWRATQKEPWHDLGSVSVPTS